MINQLQDAIILAGGLVLLCAVSVSIVLMAMIVYFETRKHMAYRRRAYQARLLHEDDLALERAWRQYKRDTNLEHATRGDKMEFMERMRAS